jgi:hypothetical protein
VLLLNRDSYMSLARIIGSLSGLTLGFALGLAPGIVDVLKPTYYARTFGARETIGLFLPIALFLSLAYGYVGFLIAPRFVRSGRKRAGETSDPEAWPPPANDGRS